LNFYFIIDDIVRYALVKRELAAMMTIALMSEKRVFIMNFRNIL